MVEEDQTPSSGGQDHGIRGDSADYRQLFLSGAPMMDLRAPVEFARGAFPGVVNLPLLTDPEREAVGTCYNREGQEAAIRLGHRLVAGSTRAARIEAWAAFARAHPTGYLYCFRGGLRSQIVQTWLREEAGIAYPRVTGGYKALRGFLLAFLEAIITVQPLRLLGGLTGSGKTELIARHPWGLDLEGHARHRGSAFGSRLGGQPAQIDFENQLSIDLLRKTAQSPHPLPWVLLEDEGQHIGRCALPLCLRQAMARAPVIWLEAPLEERVRRIQDDYIHGQLAEHLAAAPATPAGVAAAHGAFGEQLRGGLQRMAKRLGEVRYRQARQYLDAALAAQVRDQDCSGHGAWIRLLLSEYYDPMYAYQRTRLADRLCFSGDRRAVEDWLAPSPSSSNGHIPSAN